MTQLRRIKNWLDAIEVELKVTKGKIECEERFWNKITTLCENLLQKKYMYIIFIYLQINSMSSRMFKALQNDDKQSWMENYKYWTKEGARQLSSHNGINN